MEKGVTYATQRISPVNNICFPGACRCVARLLSENTGTEAQVGLLQTVLAPQKFVRTELLHNRSCTEQKHQKGVKPYKLQGQHKYRGSGIIHNTAALVP